MEGNGNGTTEGFYCEPCDETTETSEGDHKMSFLHKARAEYTEAQAKKKEWEESKGYAGHFALTGVKTERPMSKPTIELLSWVPVCRKPLVGMEHIVEVAPQFNDRRYYLCTLCAKSDIQVFAHMLSIEHVTTYLAEHVEEVSEVVDKYFDGKDTEKALLQPLIEAKGWPIMDTRNHEDKLVKEVRKVLLDLSVQLTQSIKRKRFTCAVEIESKPPGKERPVQQPLVNQLIGHTADHYPYDLQDALYYYGYNFAYEPPAGWSDAGGLDQGFDSLGGGAPAGVVTMGQAKNKVITEPIPFLQWLQKTESKVLSEGLDQPGIEAAESVKGLLACGIELFTSNPTPPTTICYYSKDPVNESIPLNQWMGLTNTFFEEAWMCSQREVAAAQALITHIEKAVADAKAGKTPTADPYAKLNLGASSVMSQDPYAKLGLRASSAGGGMGGRLSQMAMGGGGYGGMQGGGYQGFDDGYQGFGGGFGDGYGGGPMGGGPRALMGGRGGGTMGGGKPYMRQGGGGGFGRGGGGGGGGFGRGGGGGRGGRGGRGRSGFAR